MNIINFIAPEYVNKRVQAQSKGFGKVSAKIKTADDAKFLFSTESVRVCKKIYSILNPNFLLYGLMVYRTPANVLHGAR